MTKLTNAMALTVAIEAVTDEAVKAKLQKMLEQVEKKNSADRKPTKTQTENVALKDAIYAHMAFGQKYTITDLMNQCEAIKGMTNQKVSALVRQLISDGRVVREEIKRKAYFSLREEV